MHSGYVYFASNKARTKIKIGFSRMPIRRVRQLRADLIKIIRASNDTERLLHSKFVALRRDGEWFEDCYELRKFIDEQNGVGPNDPGMNVPLYISIPAEIYDVIAQRAKDAHRPISAQVGMVLLAYAKKWLPANGNRA